MRRFCAFVFLFISVQLFNSCQKELSFEGSPAPAGPLDDSIILVKTIRTKIYDDFDAFQNEQMQTFTYDKSLNKTLVDISDSGRYGNGAVQRYTVTFQYDDNNRVSKYSAAGDFAIATQIDFTYNAAGDLIKSAMVEQWAGKTFIFDYSITTQNGLKIITVYDTSGVTNGLDSRPEIYKHVFDSNDRLVKEYNYFTTSNQIRYEDTIETNYFYDSKNFISKVTDKLSYGQGQSSAQPAFYRDSTLYTSEGSTNELRNSFFYVYKNVYWLNIDEYFSGFSDAISKNGLIHYSGAAIKTAEFWTFNPPDPSTNDHQIGLYQNTFDANGLLAKTVIPKKFENKYGGKSEIWYTYTKIKK